MNRSHHRRNSSAMLSVLLIGLIVGCALVSSAPANAAADWATTALGIAADTAAYDVTDAWRYSGDMARRRSAYVADRLNSPLAYDSRTGEPVDRWQSLSGVDRGDDVEEYRIAFLGTGLGPAMGRAVLGAAPTLDFPAAPYDDGVDPDSGSADAPATVAFTFRIDYADGDGEAPTAASDVEYATNPSFTGATAVNMTLAAGTPDDGTYTATVNLPAGATYYYRFVFNDAGLEGPVIEEGPNPIVVNDIPNITNQANTAPNPATPATDETAETTISCTYTDADNDAPTTSNVTVYRADGSVYNTYPMTPTSAPPFVYSAGVDYGVTVDLPAGDHYYYRFNFSDGTTTVNDPLYQPYHGPIDVAATPILLNESYTILDPSISEPTRVQFNVTYKEADAEDNAQFRPVTHQLFVYYYDEGTNTLIPYNEGDFTFPPPYNTYADSSPYSMYSKKPEPLYPADFEAGVEYERVVVLHRPGLYFYTFEFENAVGAGSENIRMPLGADVHTDPGPPVIDGGDVLPDTQNGIEITRTPTLTFLPEPYDDGADPNDGDGDPTTVTFRIKYADPDNEAPTLHQVRIYTDSNLTVPWGAGSYDLNKISGDPVNGEVYSRTLDLPSPGSYYYFFVFDNATYNIGSLPNSVLRRPTLGSTPDYLSLVMVNQAPILSNYSLNPTSGGQGDTYTFTVDYTDYDNDPPADTDGAGNPVVLLQIEQLSASGAVLDTQQLDLQQVAAGAETWNDGDYSNGERFTIDVQGIDPAGDAIGDGGHRFYFEASDGDNDTVFPAGADTTVANRLLGPDINDAPSAVAGGFDPSGGTELESTEVRPTISWNAAGDINATDPPSTLRYRVELSNDGFASVFTEFTTAAGVTSGAPGEDLTPGDWSYRIITIDDSDEESAASTAQTFHLNGLPTLSAGQVDPTGPDPTDWTGAGEDPAPGDSFDFQVVYTDADDDAPATIEVVVQNGTTQSFALAPLGGGGLLGDGDYTNGELYGVTVTGATIGDGTDGVHAYYFKANDGLEDADNHVPAVSEFEVNDAPNAVTSGFTPPAGDVHLTPEEFSWDAATDPNSSDPSTSLTYRIEVDRWSNDWENADYTYTTAAGVTTVAVPDDWDLTLDTGTWYWRVVAIDDGGAETPSAAQTFNVVDSEPVLSLVADATYAQGVDPLTGAQADTYTFKVNYTDADNDAPASIAVVVTNTTTGTVYPPFAMDFDGFDGAPDYIGGEDFKVELTSADIGDGEHTFYFQASDGQTDVTLYEGAPTTPFDGPTLNDAPAAPTGTFTPSGGTEVTTNTPTLDWPDGTDPNPTDDATTLTYRVEMSQTTGPFTPVAAYEITTDPGVTQAEVPQPLAEGDWYWRVYTVDDMDVESPASAEQHFVVNTNNPPVLSLDAAPFDDGVDPNTGGLNDDFVFRVQYADPDGDAPASPDLVITDPATGAELFRDTMLPVDAPPFDYVGGEMFEITVSGWDIGQAQSQFYFEASDGTETVVLPATAPNSQYTGPAINDAPNPPTTGFDPSGGETVTDRRPTITWDPATDINASDTAATLRYRVEFSLDPAFGAIEGTYTFTTAAGVTTGQAPQPMANGTWYYRVITIDDQDVESTPSAIQQFVVQASQVPVLSNPVLTPATGGEGDVFTFEVTYSDPNNDPPVNDMVQVYVSGTATPWDMTEKNAPPYDYTAGVVYTVQVAGAQMGDGEHTHYFEASDGTTTVTLPVGGGAIGLDGPSVNDAPNPPTSGFDPINGEVLANRLPDITWDDATDPNASDTAATLSYRVEFSASNAPFTIDAAYTVTTDPGVTTAQPAAELPNGTWYYRVVTIDDQGAESTPSTVQNFVVELNTAPVLSAPSVNPASAGLSGSYVFEVTYTDDDGDAPASIQVIVTNTETGDPAVARNMTPRDPGPYDFTAGVVYRAAVAGTLIADGEHTHYFSATDGTDTTDLYQVAPDTEFPGPLVNDPPNPPDSGFDPTGGTVVHNRQPLIAWDPGTDPNPTDPEDTLQYRIEFSQTATPFTVEAAYTALSNVGVASARPNAPLPEAAQQWYYRVFAIDNSGAVSLTSSPVQMFQLDLNHAPEAPQPDTNYSPADGSIVRTSTPTFMWPTATDQDPLDTSNLLHYEIQVDDAPDFLTPLIDDATAAGVTQYTVAAADALNLDAQYWWRVRTVDPQGAVSDWTEVALGLPAPLSFTTALQSVLINPDVTPVYGTLATVFTCSVEYWDSDNLPPAGPIEVVIGPGAAVVKTLARDITGDGNYANGELYKGVVTGAELGIGAFDHFFRVNTADPLFQVETTVDPGPIVGVDGQLRFTDAAWADVAGYEEGDTAYLEADDADENRDPAVVDTIDVQVNSELGDSETVTLTETGVDTGLFRGQIDTLGRPGAVDDGALNLASGPTGTTITAVWADPDGGPNAVDTALITDTVAPAVVPPANITVTSGASGTSATVNWAPFNEAGQIDIAGYHVWMSTTNFNDTADATQVATTGAGTQNAIVPGLTPNTDYFFAVTPFDEVPNENTAVGTVGLTTADTVAPYLANQLPVAGATEQPLDTNISFDIRDDGVGVDFATIVVELDGNDITGAVSITPAGGNASVSYDPPTDFNYNDTPQIHVVASDLDGNTLDTTYGFGVVTDVQPPQVANWLFGTGGTLSFDLTDDISGVDMSTFVLQVDGTDVTADATWDDSDPLNVSVNYAPADGWPFSQTLNFSVGVSDFAGNAMPAFTAQEDTEVDDTAPVADQLNPADGATDVAVDTAISLRLRDSQSGVDTDTIVMTVNGTDVTAELDFGVAPAAAGRADVTATYQPATPLDYDTDYDVHVEASDVVGNSTTVDWSFTTGAEPTYEIRGTVLDAAGNPMPGVEVTAGGNIAITDGNGVYRLQGLLAGTYTVTPSFPEYDFEPVSQDVTVGPDARDVDFTGTVRTYSISGTVTRGGAGVQGVTVSDGTRTATTDADGNYTITDVPNGVYTVTPTRDANNDGFQDFTYTPQTQTANVEGANVAGVDFSATVVTYTISGTISDNAGNRIAGVTVSDGTRTAITNEAGQFTISGVPASTVTLTPTRAGLAFDPQTRQVTVPPASTGNNFTAYTEFRQRFGAGLHMVAVPAAPPANRDRAVDVFQTDAVARWDAMSNPQGYVFGRDNPDALQLEVRPGAGFFVNFPAPTDVVVPGDPVDENGTFSVGVATGWNQIGNPFETALPLANISGAGSTQVRRFGFIYDPAVGSYRMVSPEPAFNSARTYIDAWESAWFKATGAAGTLNIAAPNGTATAMLDGADAEIAAPDNGWLVEIVARVADRADVTTVAGVGSGDAAEGYRVDNPPMLPGSVDVYFTDESGNRLAHDIRPASSGPMVWPFAVQTDIANAEVELTLPDLSGVPADMAVYLTDVDSGKRMYARTLPAYTFTSGADGALRHFELEVAPRGADNLTIRTASVQPAGGGMMVTYDVSSAASVSIEVLNIAGRSVRSLVQSRAVPAGVNEQMWDMRSADGTLVPNGSYLIKIEAVAENGQRVQALRPAQIAR